MKRIYNDVGMCCIRIGRRVIDGTPTFTLGNVFSRRPNEQRPIGQRFQFAFNHRHVVGTLNLVVATDTDFFYKQTQCYLIANVFFFVNIGMSFV